LIHLIRETGSLNQRNWFILIYVIRRIVLHHRFNSTFLGSECTLISWLHFLSFKIGFYTDLIVTNS